MRPVTYIPWWLLILIVTLLNYYGALDRVTVNIVWIQTNIWGIEVLISLPGNGVFSVFIYHLSSATIHSVPNGLKKTAMTMCNIGVARVGVNYISNIFLFCLVIFLFYYCTIKKQIIQLAIINL